MAEDVLQAQIRDLTLALRQKEMENEHLRMENRRLAETILGIRKNLDSCIAACTPLPEDRR